jgi:hypothetical protein
MAFLPSLQATVQSHTGGFLFFRTEPRKETSSEVSIYPDLPIGRHGSLEAFFPWRRSNASGYRSLLEGITWETESTSSTILFESLPTTFSPSEEPWGTWSSETFTSLDSQETQEFGRGILTYITWQPHVKLRESNYKLLLDLQDLFLGWKIWQEHSLIAGSSSSTEVQSLEHVYTFRKSSEVSYFLEEHPFLTPLLREAYSHIRKYFPSSTLFLEVVADPEARDEEQLVVFVAVNQDPDEASKALDQFDKDWWLDALERARDKLTITLEFQ